MINNTGFKKPSILESRAYDLFDNFVTAKILIGMRDYPIFQEKRKAKSRKEGCYCQCKEAAAIDELTEGAFLLHKGGKANIEETKGMNK
jgi:hypothetical protein